MNRHPASQDAETMPAFRAAESLRKGGGGAETNATLITGGAGFIGTNLADHLLRSGRQVVLLDNLSRPGVGENAAWLRARYGERVRILIEDMRDAAAVRRAVGTIGHGLAGVIHLAAQVAVTSSLDDPAHDFAVNAGGTLHLLEALRALPTPPPLLFTSTNKVYGSLDDVALLRRDGRYAPCDGALAARGIDERRPLDFHSPYGCSKGAADQYVLDYARSFGLPAVVFRMSCIYGPHQHGTEDQGWVAHFLRRAMAGQPLTIYGDGCQVRDCLYVGDLVQAMMAALAGLRAGTGVAGRAFNIGGGPDRAISLLELITLIAELRGVAPGVRWGEWRPGDQRYYVSNCAAFAAATGWTPRTSVREGVGRLYRWLAQREAARGVLCGADQGVDGVGCPADAAEKAGAEAVEVVVPAAREGAPA